MSRTCLFVLIALFAITTVLARSTAVEPRSRLRPASPSTLSNSKDTCGRHGDDCSKGQQCCDTTRCHPYALKCRAVITDTDLQEQRKKLRHVEINAHKKNI